MDNKTINVLGQEYKIKVQTEEENSKLKDADGLCEMYSKEIILNGFEVTSEMVDNIQSYKDKVLRHEIIHAFLIESGLDTSSGWARNEEMVDFFAYQIPKMYKIFKELNIDK